MEVPTAMNGRTAAPTLETLLAEREWVRTLARVLAGNGADADDLEQEAWVAALRSPPERPGPVRGWLATVMRRRRLDAGRAAARRLARESAAARPEALPSAAESVARAETLRRVVEAVLSLEEPGRSTVILRYFDGLPPREIAARTGVPVEAVYGRLRRALDELRERLGGDGEGRRAWAFLLPAAAVVAAAAAGALLLRGDPPTAPVLSVASAPPSIVVEEPPPAPPSPAPVPVVVPPVADEKPAGGLVLRARVEPASPRFREPVRLVATFENAGKEPVAIFHPHVTVDAVFPRWTLRDADGREFQPDPEWMGQSMWSEGPQGEVVRLGPGETRSVEESVDLLVPADGKGPKVPLRPGTWIVRCSYARADALVPWSEAFGKPNVRRAVDGLWTGTVEAEPFEVRVLPSESAAIALSIPGDLVPGKPCPVEVTLENTAAAPLVLKGRLLLRSVQKGTGTLDEVVLAPEGGEEIRVEGESTLVVKADLARLPGDWLDRNAVMLLAVLDFAEEGRPDLVSELVIRRVGPMAAARGLRLTAEHRGNGVLAVTLRNDGREAVRVPKGFAWPARLHVAARDPEGEMITVSEDGGKSSHSALVMGWDEPGTPRPLAADDVVVLEPGGLMEATVDLLAEGRPRLPAGTYDVTVSWRNVEGGPRAGLEEGAIVVGAVAAPAVKVELPAK